MGRKRTQSTSQKGVNPRKKNRKLVDQNEQPQHQYQQILNPLQIDLIVGKVLSYLNVSDLKNIRLVSSVWQSVGRKYLIEKCLLRPKFASWYKDKEENEQEVKNVLSFIGTSKVVHMSVDYQELRLVYHYISELLEKVTILEYKQPRDQLPYIQPNVQQLFLIEILGKFSNLKVLMLTSLKLNIGHSERESLLKKLEAVKEIQLDLHIPTDYFFHDILAYHDQLKSTTKVKLTSSHWSNLSLNLQIFMASSFKWPLTHVNWDIVNSVDKKFAHEFFRRIAGTLQSLKISVQHQEIIPWTDDWYLPTDMPHLKTLTIINGNSSALAIAVQLPRLKSLICSWYNEPKGWSWIETWENHASAQGRKLKSDSLTNVEFQNFGKMPYDGSLWPNIRSLKIHEVKQSSNNPLMSWREIDKLELDFTRLPLLMVDAHIYWLTGLQPPFYHYCRRSLVDPNEQSNGIVLRDLNNLKSLTIRGRRGDYNGTFGDFFVYNCFQFMKELQSLEFYGIQFSSRALEFLREKLGPGVAIIVHHK